MQSQLRFFYKINYFKLHSDDTFKIFLALAKVTGSFSTIKWFGWRRGFEGTRLRKSLFSDVVEIVKSREELGTEESLFQLS